ncbi:MAG TPA: helix-turn-helix transcriptional regulator [Kofleriaceae bacterium]|nr:helix-turn-helix transcriptional regulator [Kofleriaceae bacterium]
MVGLPIVRLVVRQAARIDPISRALGLRLRALRDAANVTQEDLGRRAKLSPKFISAIENGHTNPSIGAVARLSAALGLPLTAFFSEDPPGEVVDDVMAMAALLASRPAPARRRALKIVRALFEE